MKGDFFIMKSICIKSNNKYIIDYLLKEFSDINLDSIYLSYNHFKIYDNVIVHFTGNEIDIFYETLCDILTKCIVFFYEKNLIKNLLYYNYFYLSDIEIKQILDECINLLNSDLIVYKEKYNAIYSSVYDYICEHHSLVLHRICKFSFKKI